MKRIFWALAILSLMSVGVMITQTTHQKILAAQTQSEPSTSKESNSEIDLSTEGKQIENAVLGPKAVKIPFSAFIEKGNSKQILTSGNMYYSRGNLFVLHEKSDQKDRPINYATINGKLYRWEFGAKQGKILKRYARDTEALLSYLLDVSFIKGSVYRNYREKPSNFLVSQEGDTKTILYKQISEGFAGIKIQESPFWMSSFLSCECVSITSTTALAIFEINRPIPLEKIPDSVKVLPSGMKFKPTEATVESDMVYL
ncbi:hypothetical protein K9N68_31560 [Kovacikia minuta CCNUW1]|uniref:hypothetical protein n=1 Tax=Kovacikia minuta TaxID=2931930 RepID=UPI001CCF918D|nr:hypothetical protein [Kovacikia minuta]UBF26023.1 hypothetical protein K9N68_31560 [Kovacikia minuta CCNUW1]